MEFKGQYLKYEQYRALGGELNHAPFNLLEFEARKKIDSRTQNRLKDIEEIPQEVKICVYKIIDCLVSYANENNSKNVASENIDGYSVSYLTPSQLQEVITLKRVEIDNIIASSLYGLIVNGEHVLYLGVAEC